MAGKLSIPKFKDYRNKIKRHSFKKFPVLTASGKTTIAIHHSLTKQGLGGSNAESYAKYHVDTHGWPSIGYHYVIEPDGTIKWCNDIELRTYHVGNHNNYAIGICLTGDFRYEEPTNNQKDSLRNLVNALKKTYPNLKNVKGHNEFSGYEWKACPVFDYKKVLEGKSISVQPKQPPQTYTVQEGDTFYSIAKGMSGVTADALMKANPKVKETEMKIGTKLTVPGGKTISKPKPSTKSNLIVDGKWGTDVTKALQKALGTPVDGIISKQSRNSVTTSLYSNTVQFGSGGSVMIRALQRKLKVTADGLLGPATVRALQKLLGTPVDGVLSRPSMVVKELQRRLNAGTF